MSVSALLEANSMSGFYPDSWDEFTGQILAKRMLKVASASARTRGDRLGHVLLASPHPGIGKTTLALLTAAELGAQVKILSGKIDANAARIALASLEDGDVLFVDEIHRLVSKSSKAGAEWLLHLMTDGVIIGPAGPEPQPDITIIGTTTDAGVLPQTVLSRFALRPKLVRYDSGEALEIAMLMAQRSFAGMPFPALDTFKAVCLAANNNPRVIRNLLDAVRDIALDAGHEDEDYPVTEALSWLSLTYDGLTEAGLRYLRVLVHDFGGTAGKQAIEAQLGEPLDEAESLLIEKGLVKRTQRGRVATGDGIRRILNEQSEES